MELLNGRLDVITIALFMLGQLITVFFWGTRISADVKYLTRDFNILKTLVESKIIADQGSIERRVSRLEWHARQINGNLDIVEEVL